MEYWHQVGKDLTVSPRFTVKIFYRHSDERLSDLYPEYSQEELKEKYDQLERHDSSLFDVRLNYIYRNKITFSEICRYNYHYDGFPEDVISNGLDGEIESMMVEGMREAMATANILLDNLKNDFENDS